MKKNRFFDQLKFMFARYDSECNECGMSIKKGDPIVYMASYKITMHMLCFKHGPQIHNQRYLLTGGNDKRKINYFIETKIQFMILLHKLIRIK